MGLFGSDNAQFGMLGLSAGQAQYLAEQQYQEYQRRINHAMTSSAVAAPKEQEPTNTLLLLED